MSGKHSRHAKYKPQFKNDSADQRFGTGAEDNFDSQAKDAKALPEERLDNVGFVVELFLDDRRQVRLTQALHVKSAEGEAWDGWDEKRLIAFLVKQASVRIPATAPQADPAGLRTLNLFLDRLRRDFAVLADQGKQFDLRMNKTHGFRAYIACEGESAPVEIPRALLNDLGVETMEVIMETALALSAPKKIKAKMQSQQPVDADGGKPETPLEPNLVRQKVDVIPARAESPSRVLKSGEPFRLRFPIDRAAMEQRGKAPVNYRANVAARMWEDRSERTLGQKAGVVQEADEAVLIEIAQQELPPGVYRFEADLEFNFEQAEPAGHASLSSGFVQVV